MLSVFGYLRMVKNLGRDSMVDDVQPTPPGSILNVTDTTDGSFEENRLAYGSTNRAFGDIEEFKSCFSIPNVPVLLNTFTKYNNRSKWLDYFSKNEIPFEDNNQNPGHSNINEMLGLLPGLDITNFPILRCDYIIRDVIYNNRLNEEGEYVFEEKEDGYLYPIVDMTPLYTPKELWFTDIQQLIDINFAEIFHERFGLEEYAVEEEE